MHASTQAPAAHFSPGGQAAPVHASTQAPAAQVSPASADAARGKQLYESRCIACHSVDQNRVGPAHKGVFGRKAGSAKGYDYSAALKKSRMIWNEKALDRWLATPPGEVLALAAPPLLATTAVAASLLIIAAEAVLATALVRRPGARWLHPCLWAFLALLALTRQELVFVVLLVALAVAMLAGTPGGRMRWAYLGLGAAVLPWAMTRL